MKKKSENKGRIMRICKHEELKKENKPGLHIFIVGCIFTIFWSLILLFHTFDDIAFSFLMLFLTGIQLIFLGLAIYTSGYRSMIIYSNGVESSFYLFFKKLESKSSFYPYDEFENVKYESKTETTYSNIEIFLKMVKRFQKLLMINQTMKWLKNS